MSSFSISFDISTNCPTLGMGFEFWLDDAKHVDIPDLQVAETIKIDNIVDTDQRNKRTMTWVFKNKKPWHTIIDDSGKFLQDPVINISNFKIDGIDCNYILHKNSEYHHDFNGSNNPTIEKFYGVMGCNGQVILHYDTPIFVWLLEQM